MAGGPKPFYVTGGTLRYDAPSYVARDADEQLFRGLTHGEFCYVLTSRQMGKSSLMVRTAQRLRERDTDVIVLDLTAIGQNLTAEQWFDGLLLRIGRQLGLEDELETFWHEHPRLGPCQRFLAGLHDVALLRCRRALVIFIDEIDSVRSLPFSTDEFFAAIRGCYNRRSEDPAFNRLTFCLLGVATPSDLIRDSRTTPFNIGRRVELRDFTLQEAGILAHGLQFGADGVQDMTAEEARTLLDRVLYWTGGHPFLTQRVCRAVADHNDAVDVTAKIHSTRGLDHLVSDLFFSPRAREKDDNLLFVRERMLRSECDLSALLDLYSKVLRSEKVPDDESNPLVDVLHLAGIVRPGSPLAVRNRIYARVFDGAWVLANTPDAERIRQREAFRKGVRRGVVAGVIVLTVGFLLFLGARRRVANWDAARTLDRLAERYASLTNYADECELRQEFEMLGAQVVTSSRLSLSVQKPDRLRMTAALRTGSGDLRLEIVRNGGRLWVHVPTLEVYVAREETNSLADTLTRSGRWVSGVLSDSLYHLPLSTDPELTLRREARRVNLARREVLDGMPVHVLGWQMPFGTNSHPLSTNEAAVPRPTVPVTVWVNPEEGVIRQMSLDYSGVITNTVLPAGGRDAPQVAMQHFVVTTRHSNIRINRPDNGMSFDFVPPPGTRRVDESELNALLSGEVQGDTPPPPGPRQPLTIPPRDPRTPAQLIDLTAHYNGRLDVPWHSGLAGNDLSALPPGIRTFNGVEFDLRGVIQLAGTGEAYMQQLFPARISSVEVRQAVRRLHLLLGGAWTARDGAQVGFVLVRYADGAQRSVPLTYGYDLRNWWSQPGEGTADTGLQVAWVGRNAVQPEIRLYQVAWLNPRPEVPVTMLEFHSSLSPCAPFILAVTAEP